MSTRPESGWCGHCRRLVRADRRECNHVLHALLSLFFCGFWLPVWFVAWVVSTDRKGKCNRCGSEVET